MYQFFGEFQTIESIAPTGVLFENCTYEDGDISVYVYGSVEVILSSGKSIPFRGYAYSEKKESTTEQACSFARSRLKRFFRELSLTLHMINQGDVTVDRTGKCSRRVLDVIFYPELKELYYNLEKHQSVIVPCP